MGHKISKSDTVNLGAAHPEYLAEAYTVVRTSGEKQDGWRFMVEEHKCTVSGWLPTSHAALVTDEWRVFLHNGDLLPETVNQHACGWRRLGTFWPTRLTGDEGGIEAWTEALRKRLETLEEARVAAAAASAAPAEPTAAATALDAALERLGAKPYHPVYAPLSEQERAKRSGEDMRIAFADPDAEEEIAKEVEEARAKRERAERERAERERTERERKEQEEKQRVDALAHFAMAIRASEEHALEVDKKRVADAAAAGQPVPEVTLEQLLALRRKYVRTSDETCPATADRKHTYTPMRHCGNSWHGPVYSKDCYSCGHSWSSH